MTPEKIAEAMEVMAEAQSEEPPEGERPVECDAVIGRVGEDDQILMLAKCTSRVIDALTDNGFFVRVDNGGAFVEWREAA